MGSPWTRCWKVHSPRLSKLGSDSSNPCQRSGLDAARARTHELLSAVDKEAFPPMDTWNQFSDLPLAVQAAVICISICFTTLVVLLISAPQRNCFFLRLPPETRLLMLLASPIMLIIWPVVILTHFLEARGIDPGSQDWHDFFDD